MKKTTLISFLLKLVILLMVSHASAQNLIGSRIDVQGARFSDQMWIFSVASCTYNFDNGWDGYKMFGTLLAPQLFAIEPDGYYQVDAIPDVNNTYLGFSAGVDTVYTFTFTNQNLAMRYQQLYLIDSVANKTVDIYQTGTKYTFSALATSNPVKRFKIVTSKPTDPIVNLSQTVSVTTNLNQTNSKDTNLKIYYSDKNIYIENPGNQKGKMVLCNAETGKILKTADFNALGTSIINSNVPKGIYVVNGVTQSDNVSTKILIQ